MLAITTKYLGPTDTKGARIAATTANGHRAVIGYPHERSGSSAHWLAVLALLERHPGLKGGEAAPQYVAGEVKGGYVFVPAERGPFTAIHLPPLCPDCKGQGSDDGSTSGDTAICGTCDGWGYWR